MGKKLGFFDTSKEGNRQMLRGRVHRFGWTVFKGEDGDEVIYVSCGVPERMRKAMLVAGDGLRFHRCMCCGFADLSTIAASTAKGVICSSCSTDNTAVIAMSLPGADALGWKTPSFEERAGMVEDGEFGKHGGFHLDRNLNRLEIEKAARARVISCRPIAPLPT
jgi:hypothetical protein